MRLYVVRHGKAERMSETGRDDDRQLTDRGQRQIEHLAVNIASREDVPAALLASPIRRAIETARLLHAALGGALRTETSLMTGQPASMAIDLVESHAPVESLMLIGHNPQLEEVIEWLTRGRCSGCDELRTGEAVILETPREHILGRCRVIDRLRFDEV